VIENVPADLYIGGEWRAASGGGTFGVEDPATGETLVEIADGTPDDAKAASTPPRTPGELAANARPTCAARSRRAFEAPPTDDELALLMTLEMGKSVAESKARSPTQPSSSAGSRARRCGSTGTTRWPATRRAAFLVMRQPVGPSFFITPWNFRRRWDAEDRPGDRGRLHDDRNPAQPRRYRRLALAKLLEEAVCRPACSTS